MKKIGLAVMRLQPFHEGHAILIRRMLQMCDEAVIAVGSTQESGTARNPYTYEERRMMIQNAFPEAKNLRILPLTDIGAKSKREWVDYLMGELDKAGVPHPTHYFSGSDEDAGWYTETGWEIVIVDRETEGKGHSATRIRELMAKSR
jgi:nicotinamide-nucleotide adenylyltransferase